MYRAVEINAVVKAVNLAAEDEDALLSAAAKLASVPELKGYWQFRIKEGRLCADARPTSRPQDVEQFIEELLSIATKDSERKARAYQVFQHLKGYEYLADGVASEVDHG